MSWTGWPSWATPPTGGCCRHRTTACRSCGPGSCWSLCGRTTSPTSPGPNPHGEPRTVGETLRELMAANGWPGAAAWAAKASDIAPTIVGGSKKHGGADLGPTRAKRAWREMGVDALGVADAAPSADDPVTLLPKLTCEMVARLQGWDGREYRWEFTGRKTSNYRQIGNAFPPPVARAIGEQIRRALDHQGEPRHLVEQSPTAHDPVYTVLRDDGGFLTMEQILRRLARPARRPRVRAAPGPPQARLPHRSRERASPETPTGWARSRPSSARTTTSATRPSCTPPRSANTCRSRGPAGQQAGRTAAPAPLRRGPIGLV